MSTEKKPRADSVLKTLPPDRQAAIAEYLREHSLKDTRQWLAADGLKTSEAALSGFLSWFALQARLQRNGSTVAQVLADLKQEDPSLNDEQLDRAGQRFFTALAISEEDSLAWKRAQDIKVKNQALVLLERRIKLLEAKATQADETDKVLKDAELSPEQRAQRIKEIYGRA